MSPRNTPAPTLFRTVPMVNLSELRLIRTLIMTPESAA